jgi:Rps23 Pro-64 3,4-dihydroxylase Tpa1-like proline 4-hydroxylase
VCTPRTHNCFFFFITSSPGGQGFARHKDNSGPKDPRRITAIYYLSDKTNGLASSGSIEEVNVDEKAKDKEGHLVLYLSSEKQDPSGDEKCVCISPNHDRLVLFRSDEIDHEVLPLTKSSSQDRMAISYWYVGSGYHNDGGEIAPEDDVSGLTPLKDYVDALAKR